MDQNQDEWREWRENALMDITRTLQLLLRVVLVLHEDFLDEEEADQNWYAINRMGEQMEAILAIIAAVDNVRHTL